MGGAYNNYGLYWWYLFHMDPCFSRHCTVCNVIRLNELNHDKYLVLQCVFFFIFIKSGARVVAFDQHHAVLVVSKPSPNQLFPGFGVVKVSAYKNLNKKYTAVYMYVYLQCYHGFQYPFKVHVDVQCRGWYCVPCVQRS